MYPDKTTDKIMIPQWEYRKLRDIATRVGVLLAEIDADMDFPEEDLEITSTDNVVNALKEVIARINVQILM